MEIFVGLVVLAVAAWAVAKFYFGYDILEHLPKNDATVEDENKDDPFEPKN